jgi:tryptophanyl-tRNA synthetase
VATLPGTDGRKMSKSYDNTIPLWLPARDLRKAILGIVTDSRAPGEAKDADTSNIFAIYQAFASANETATMRQAFLDGIAWGEAKEALFERINAELAPMRQRYEELVANPSGIEDLLVEGARKARKLATPLLEKLRGAVGIRHLGLHGVGTSSGVAWKKAPPTSHVTALPQLKSYRENDGRFYFKLAAADGSLLLQSRAFDAPKDAGRLGAALVDAGDDAKAVTDLLAQCAPVGEPVQSIDAIVAALAQLKADKLAKQTRKD